MHVFPSVQAVFFSSLGFCNDYYKQVAEILFPSVSRSVLGSCCSCYSLLLKYLRLHYCITLEIARDTPRSQVDHEATVSLSQFRVVTQIMQNTQRMNDLQNVSRVSGFES
jgi:hypothetical protein